MGLRRLVNTIRSGWLQREIDREIREREEDLRASGVSLEEARRRARIQFGNPLVQRERTQDADVAMWLETSLRNLRHAVRAVVRVPGFSLTVVLTLALGIGANSAVFSAMDCALRRLHSPALRDALRRLALRSRDTVGRGAHGTDRGDARIAGPRITRRVRATDACLA